jgi:hypothetical protein
MATLHRIWCIAAGLGPEQINCCQIDRAMNR